MLLAAASTALTTRCSASAAAVGPVLFDQRVGAFEADERDRDGPVLRRATAGQHMRADRRRTGSAPASRRQLRPRGQGIPLRMARRLAQQQQAGSLGARPRTRPASAAAVSGLTTISSGGCRRAASPRGGSRRGPPAATPECDRPTAKKWNCPECTPCAIRSVTSAVGKLDAPDVAQHPAHQRPPRGRRAPRVPRRSNQSSSASPPNLSRLPPFS